MRVCAGGILAAWVQVWVGIRNHVAFDRRGRGPTFRRPLEEATQAVHQAGSRRLHVLVDRDWGRTRGTSGG